jgi:hypothetical protein
LARAHLGRAPSFARRGRTPLGVDVLHRSACSPRRSPAYSAAAHSARSASGTALRSEAASPGRAMRSRRRDGRRASPSVGFIATSQRATARRRSPSHSRPARPNKVADRRLCDQPANQHGVALVLRARPGPPELAATREPSPHRPRLSVGHPQPSNDPAASNLASARASSRSVFAPVSFLAVDRREPVGKRHRRIRAHGTPGPVAGAATEKSGSKPIAQETACPACVPQRARVPVSRTYGQARTPTLRATVSWRDERKPVM